jgi:lipoate-protein ligase A
VEKQTVEIYCKQLKYKQMKLIVNDSKSPYFNLALEEFLLTKSEGEFFVLWQNEPTLVVGCHQNTAAEVDVPKAVAQGVHIVRRITGGGAVYHDLGNVNFSLIKTGSSAGSCAKELYAELSRPVLAALAQLGVAAELSGRNDITVEGKKISGCAQHTRNNRTLLHGALLFNTNLNVLAELLTPHNKKFEGKAIQSVSSRVANVVDFVQHSVEVDEFKRLILANIQNHTRYELTPKEVAEVQKLAREKFQTNDWIFGKVMAHTFSKHEKTSAGSVEVRINFAHSSIDSIRFFGDFFSDNDVHTLEKLLQGCPYAPEAIGARLKEVEVGQYIRGLTSEELMGLMF